MNMLQFIKPGTRKIFKWYRRFYRYIVGNNLKQIELWDGTAFLVHQKATGLERNLVKNGIFEEYITKILVDSMQPNTLFVDIGANIGYYTILLGKKILNQNLNSEIYSFEPSLNNFTILKRNIVLNAIESCTKILNYGLSDSFSSDILYYNDHNNGASTLVSNEYTQHYIKEEVLLLPGDSIIKSNYKCGLIKIDVEGYEYFVLLGIKKLLESFESRTMIIEYSPALYNVIDPTGGLPYKILSFLELFNVDIFEIDEINHTKNKISNGDLFVKNQLNQINLLVIKKTG